MPRVAFHTCPHCGAEKHTVQEITLELERSGIRIEVKGVPAFVCAECGEQYVPGPIAEAVSKAADEIFRAQERVSREPGPHRRVFRSMEITERANPPHARLAPV